MPAFLTRYLQCTCHSAHVMCDFFVVPVLGSKAIVVNASLRTAHSDGGQYFSVPVLLTIILQDNSKETRRLNAVFDSGSVGLQVPRNIPSPPQSTTKKCTVCQEYSGIFYQKARSDIHHCHRCHPYFDNYRMLAQCYADGGGYMTQTISATIAMGGANAKVTMQGTNYQYIYLIMLILYSWIKWSIHTIVTTILSTTQCPRP